MTDLNRIASVLDGLMKESESILARKQGDARTQLQQLQTRSEKLADQNDAFRTELVAMSRKIFAYEEYYHLVHPMWGAIDSARKLLAMGEPAQAARMLERAEGVWAGEVFTFDLDDFPPKVKTRFGNLADQIDALFQEASDAISQQDSDADKVLRSLLMRTNNLFDVCDDSLDILLGQLKSV